MPMKQLETLTATAHCTHKLSDTSSDKQVSEFIVSIGYRLDFTMINSTQVIQFTNAKQLILCR